MDQHTLKELTTAMDTAMAQTLQERLTALSVSITPQEAGGKLLGAQLALDRLSSGQIPNYDDAWLAPLYQAWYGPSHINMAYTLFTQIIPRHDDTLTNGLTGVHLEDYACGTFAGQFAFALAASEAVTPFSSDRLLSICSGDSSIPMWSLGEKTWGAVRSILGHPLDSEKPYLRLDSFRDTALRLKIGRESNYSAPVWLTVFHGAYDGEVGRELRTKVDELVRQNRPTLILTTSHPSRAQDSYIAPIDSYRTMARSEAGPPLALVGNFEQVTAWRRNLANEFIARMNASSEGFQDWEHQRVLSLLTERRTNWRPSNFNYVYSLYVRKNG